MSVTIDIGTVDVPFRALAESIVRDCDEDDMLRALADENGAIYRDSDDETEKAFALEASKRLRELATWFEENQP